jgi:hypothetical protein
MNELHRSAHRGRHRLRGAFIGGRPPVRESALARTGVEENMAFLFLSYFVTFVLVFQGKKKLAYGGFALSTLLSVMMFFYHTTSSLKLNF